MTSTQSQPLRAALWMIGAIVSFTSMAVAGRSLASELDTFEIMLYRSLIGVGIVLIAGGIAGSLGQINRTSFGLHLVRNVSHFIGQNLWFFALTVIPLAQVFALEFTSPIWAIFLAVIVLGEKLTKTRLLTAALGFVGILIITRPWATSLSPGVIAAALAATGFAGSAVFTRLLTRTQTITCILFWLTAMQFVFGLVTAGYDGDIAVPSSGNIPWIILISVAGLVAHFSLTKALSLAPAAIVMPVDFTRLPVIVIVGILLYNEPLESVVIIGAIIIFAANYLNILAETRRNRA
ncbi:MAG: EamA family transporter [Marinosulfonomonas sp.]|nr:MAG: EamA family transporter [Marinosulfonomonas sp.]